jgi:hypothetical protein
LHHEDQMLVDLFLILKRLPILTDVNCIASFAIIS